MVYVAQDYVSCKYSFIDVILRGLISLFLLFESQFKVEMMESMYKLAKYRYECGNYSQATSYLYFYLLVMPPSDKVSYGIPV